MTALLLHHIHFAFTFTYRYQFRQGSLSFSAVHFAAHCALPPTSPPPELLTREVGRFAVIMNRSQLTLLRNQSVSRHTCWFIISLSSSEVLLAQRVGRVGSH